MPNRHARGRGRAGICYPWPHDRKVSLCARSRRCSTATPEFLFVTIYHLVLSPVVGVNRLVSRFDRILASRSPTSRLATTATGTLRSAGGARSARGRPPSKGGADNQSTIAIKAITAKPNHGASQRPRAMPEAWSRVRSRCVAKRRKRAGIQRPRPSGLSHPPAHRAEWCPPPAA